jgi:hypothetical protein
MRLESAGSNRRLIALASKGPATGRSVELLHEALIAWQCSHSAAAKHGLPVAEVEAAEYREGTREVVRDFQRWAGVRADGIVGPITIKKLDAFVGGPTISVPCGGRHSHDITVVVKSFIAPIGTNVGFTPCAMLRSNFQRLGAFARSVDRLIHENPLDDRKDKSYRLYSARTFTVTCVAGNLVDVESSVVDTDVGDECVPLPSGLGTQCLHPPGLITFGDREGRSGPSTFDFSWSGKGRPHDLAEPGFQIVCPRNSRFIWHRVDGEIACTAQGFQVNVQLTGSQFPSHRVFVDGALQGDDPQGDFGLLWQEDPSDLTMVR